MNSETMTLITEPGIYPDFDEASYFADPCPTPSLTQSICKVLLDRSPAHARLEHPRLAPLVEGDEEETEKYVAAQAIGNAAHALLLGRGRDVAEAHYSDWKTRAAREFRDEQAKLGRMPILTKHLRRAEQMVKAARAQLDAAGHGNAFIGGKSEVMIAWQEGDLWFRSLIDWMGDTVTIWDYKTSGLSCAPHAVVERPSEAGWDIQAAMIERGLDVLDPDNAGRRKFHFVNQENDPPYALVPVLISESDLTMGRKKVAMAIDIWARCIATNQWPCYPAETVTSRPKQWLETKFLEREVEHHERGQAIAYSNVLMAG